MMKSPAADAAAERWTRYRKSKVEWSEMNDDTPAAGGNSLAQPVNPSSSSDPPRAPLRDDDEVVRNLKAENKNHFAKHALETLHRGTALDKNPDQKKAALSRVPADAPTCFKVISSIYEKSFADKKICWTNSAIALDILKRADLLSESYRLDEKARPLHIAGDSTLVLHQGNVAVYHKEDHEGRGKGFKEQWERHHDIHRLKIGNCTVAVLSSSKIKDQVKIFGKFLEEWKAICAAAGGDSLAAREKCGNIVLVLSCNESNGAKTWAPDQLTIEASRLAAILNQFPQGTVSIVWGGVGDL